MLSFEKLYTRLAAISFFMTLEAISCSSVQGASAMEPIKSQQITKTEPAKVPAGSQGKAASNSAEPAKVQINFQEEFARQLAKAGPKAEGWALFSSSPMNHNGQRWIIRSRVGKKERFKYCFIDQGEKTCSESDLSRDLFMKIQPALKAADKLSHILPNVLDGLAFEYLHAFSGNPQTKRVVFITSHKAFPEDYQKLIEAFNIDSGKK